MHIKQEIESFLQDPQNSTKATNTLKNYKTDLICFYEYLLKRQGHDDIANFTEKNIINYGQYLSTRFTADNSRRRRVQTLRIFFDYLVQKSLLKENFARLIPVSPKHLSAPSPTSLENVKQVWQHLSTTSTDQTALTTLTQMRNQLIFLLIYTGGLKVTHLTRLTIPQLSMGKTPRVLITPRKGDPFTIPLHSKFTYLFNNYQEQLRQQQAQDKITFEELFFNANQHKIIAGGISARGIELIFAELREQLNLKEFTPKTLRNAAIFAWLNQGHNPEIIKHWLGVAPSYSLGNYLKLKEYYHHNFNFL